MQDPRQNRSRCRCSRKHRRTHGTRSNRTHPRASFPGAPVKTADPPRGDVPPSRLRKKTTVPVAPPVISLFVTVVKNEHFPQPPCNRLLRFNTNNRLEIRNQDDLPALSAAKLRSCCAVAYLYDVFSHLNRGEVAAL